MLPASYSYQKLQFTACVKFLPWQRSQRSCDIGGAICSHTKWAAKKPQNPQNHWVARLHNIAFPQILVSLAPLRFYSSIVSLAVDLLGGHWVLFFGGGRCDENQDACQTIWLHASIIWHSELVDEAAIGCNCGLFFRFPGTQCMAYIYIPTFTPHNYPNLNGFRCIPYIQWFGVR